MIEEQENYQEQSSNTSQYVISQASGQDEDKSQSTNSIQSHYISGVPQNQFSISQDAVNQLLTVYLQPSKSIWTKGEIVASNQPSFSDKDIQIQNIDKKLIHFLQSNTLPPRKLANDSPDLAYYCLRQKGGGGKILFLSEQIYRQKFIFDYSKLLTITVATEQYSLSTNKVLKNLKKLEYKNKNRQSKTKVPIFITIQGSPGCIIFQKSLGIKQKMYLKSSDVLAASQSVSFHKSNTQQIYAQGPGYVFLQAKNESNNYKNPIGLIVLLQIIVTLFMPMLVSMFLMDVI